MGTIQGTNGNDTIVGGNGNDKIHGKNGDDWIDGGLGNDDIDGGKGDDTVVGGIGNDKLHGGQGHDTAVFAGSVLDFEWTAQNQNKYFVTDVNTADGDEGTDELQHFEALQFDDFTIFIDGTNNAPMLVVDGQETDEDSVLAFGVNAYDFDGDPLTLDNYTITGGGTITLAGTSVLSPVMGTGSQFAFSFDPGDFYQYLAVGEEVVETLTVVVSDDNGGTSTITTEVTITGVNDAPVAVAVAGTANEDGPQTTIVADYSDIDMTDTHTFTVDTAGTLGSVLNNNDGTFTYDPAGAYESLAVGETATDTFTYTVDDGNGGTDTATVSITITGQNDAPVAQAVTASANEDGMNEVIYADFTDVDASDMHTFTIDVTGTLGSVSNNGGGIFVYNANGAFEHLAFGETAEDTFTYTVDDGNGGTDTATVTVTVIGENDAPEAQAIAVSVSEDGPALSIAAQFTDVDTSDIQTITLDDTGVLGSVINNNDGTFSYDPNGAFEYLGVGETATESFEYTVDDGNGGTDTATVTVTVQGANDAPEAEEGAEREVNEAGGPHTINLLDYVDDPDVNDVLTFTNVTIGGRGGISFTQNGSLITFDPAIFGLDDGESIMRLLTFTVSDGNGGTDNGEIALTINGADDPLPGVNTAPNANALTVTADEGDGLIHIALSDLIFDADAGDVLTITAVTRGGAPVTFLAPNYNGEGGFLTIDPVQFGLDEGDLEAIELTYIVRDLAGAEATNVITLNLTGDTPGEGNTAPQADSLPGPFGAILDIAVDDPEVTTLTINLFDLVYDAETADAELDFTSLVLEIGRNEDGTFIEVPFTFDDLTGVVTINLAAFGLADGQSVIGNLRYEVSDGALTSNGVVTYNYTNPAPDEPVEPVLNTLTFDEMFIGEGGAEVPVFDNPDGSSIAITSFEGLTFGGGAIVIETDELEPGGGRNPNGIINGQTTVGGQNVLLATTLTETVPVLDEFDNPVIDPETRLPLTETVVTPFGMYADGAGLGIGDDPIILAENYLSGLTEAQIQSFFLDFRPELTVDYDLESISMNIASGAGNITMTTYRLDVIETVDGGVSDYSAELVVADTFVFSSNAGTPGMTLDFNDFTTHPGFETAPGSGVSRMDDVYAVTFTTDDGTAVVLDDIMVII